MKKLLNHWGVILYFLILAITFIVTISSCTVTKPEEDKTKSHKVQYRTALFGYESIWYRSVDEAKFKEYGRIPILQYVSDTAWTEIKTTTEKF